MPASSNGHIKFSFHSPDEILLLPAVPDNTIMGDCLIQKGEPFVILGEGGLGKSFVSLQLPASQILGIPLFGNPALSTYGPPLKWLIIQAENGVERLRKDMQSLKALAGPKWPLLQSHLRIHTLIEDHDGWLVLADDPTRKGLQSEIASYLPDAVIFDPLVDFAFGNLNEDAMMRANCRDISKVTKTGNPKRTPIVLHHAGTGKAGAARATGIERSGFGRNSKMLQAWARGVINMAPAGDGENIIVSCGKCSNGVPFDEFVIHRNKELFFEINRNFDLGDWEKRIHSGNSKDLSIKQALNFLKSHPNEYVTKTEAADALIEELCCSRSSAYNYVNTAEKRKVLTYFKASL